MALRSDFGTYLCLLRNGSLGRTACIGDWERVRVTALYAGGVELLSVHSTRLAAPGASGTFEALPMLFSDESAASEWEVIPACDTGAALYVNGGGLALDTGGDVAAGSAVRLVEPNAHGYQRFSLAADGRLVACLERCLCVTAPEPGHGVATLEERSDALAARQRWAAEWDAVAGAFRLCLANGRALEASGGEGGNHLVARPWHGGESQRWHVTPCCEGCVGGGLGGVAPWAGLR